MKKEANQKIKQKTFIKLPCDIGSVVYVIDTFEREVIECRFSLDMLHYVGEFVFITKTKAKDRLKKLENLQSQHLKIYLKYAGAIR